MTHVSLSGESLSSVSCSGISLSFVLFGGIAFSGVSLSAGFVVGAPRAGTVRRAARTGTRVFGVVQMSREL